MLIKFGKEQKMTFEFNGWLTPNFFKQIKLPMSKLKEYVKLTWKDVYIFMEKNKLW